ncbi:MAG: hypothetical protein M1829_000304 [Trizodia sp. TS-e1964]|nr:MAG: hypothetical protein M1829_000304 [Trizodia sp. TS-e1964]
MEAGKQPRKRKAAPKDYGKKSAKRAKVRDARAIAVQSSEKALKNGLLDVESFVRAREWEIKALEAGMASSKRSLAARALQKVPRDMRRRTASHNVKRVPKRLRARAQKEMLGGDKTPIAKSNGRKISGKKRLRLDTAKRLCALGARARAKKQLSKDAEKPLGREPKKKSLSLAVPPIPPSKFRKRQIHKTWLPTHIFHAKRAHMTDSKAPLWRFAIPLSPTEKSYRPTHRSSQLRGAIAWDTSYMSTIYLKGREEQVGTVLKNIGISEEYWGKKGGKWREGKRSLDVWAYNMEMSPYELIAPISLLWCTKEANFGVDGDGDVQMEDQKPAQRGLFLRVHPSAFLQLWAILLAFSKKQQPPVVIEDLRFEIGSIEITGPGSTEALLATLKPIHTKEDPNLPISPGKTWTSLTTHTNAAQLPPNAVLGFSISDPRLHHPSRTISPSTQEYSEGALLDLLSTWPPDVSQTAPALFSRTSRLEACRNLPSQKSVNRRKGAAIPSTYPPPLPHDPKISVLIFASRPSNSTGGPGTWIILLPWKCVLPVWYCLMHYPLSSGGHVRFGGLQEKRQVCFENGLGWFPGDFPGTKAGWEWEEMERKKLLEKWTRKPKSKRVCWESLNLGTGEKGEVGLGWACDFALFVPKPETSNAEASGVNGNDSNTKEKKDEDTKAAQTEPPSKLELPPRPNIRHIPSALFAKLLSAPPSISDPSSLSALATIKLTYLTRGSPSPCARIYRLPSAPALRTKWLNLLSKQPPVPLVPPPSTASTYLSTPGTASTFAVTPETRRALALAIFSPPAPASASSAEYPAVPGSEDLIGFVTSGSYHLGEGKGVGIGSVFVAKVLQRLRGAKAESRRQERLCVVRAAGEVVGRLARWDPI